MVAIHTLRYSATHQLATHHRDEVMQMYRRSLSAVAMTFLDVKRMLSVSERLQSYPIESVCHA